MNSKKVTTLFSHSNLYCMPGRHSWVGAGGRIGSLLSGKEYPAKGGHCSATGQTWNLR